MDQAQRVLTEIKAYLGRLSTTQRLLIASTVVIAAMTLFLVAQYAAGPSMEALPIGDGSQQAAVIRSLQMAGINATVGEGGVMVPSGQIDEALVSLTQSGDLPDDTTILFNNLIGTQDWRHSREQHRQQYIFALQNELARIISRLNGVREASVIIDAPERQGLGRASRDPTASVTVFTQGGRPLDQNTVDAVASLVAGARSGLTPANVAVIDGVTRQQRRASDEGGIAAGTYLDHSTKVELETRRKIESLLSYIPGVLVAVSAQVDVTRVSESSKRYLKDGDGTVSALPRSETNSSTSKGGGSASGAEAGVRSMQGADINQGTASRGESLEQTEDAIEFENAIGSTVRDMVDPRGMPTFLAASVNVPETYVIELLRLESPPDAPPENPTPDAVRARFDDIRTQIEASVKPHLKALGPTGAPLDGEVQVAMIPTQVLAAASAGAGGGGVLGLIGGDGGGLGGGLVDTALLGGLAVVALAMMVMMVRRSSKRVDLPTAEELVGMPPVLQSDEDLVGEAGEGEGALAGIEIFEGDVERQKMLDQIGELISAEPAKVAALLGRWMVTED